MKPGSLPLLCVLAGCATTPVERTAREAIPVAVVQAARQHVPDLRITYAERKARDGRHYYDVGGRRSDGSEIELDLLQTASGWTVVEVQRDIAWSDAPASVGAAARAALAGATPTRVIESRQADGRVVYELFTASRTDAPSHEVLLADGEAVLLTTAWPH